METFGNSHETRHSLGLDRHTPKTCCYHCHTELLIREHKNVQLSFAVLRRADLWLCVCSSEMYDACTAKRIVQQHSVTKLDMLQVEQNTYPIVRKQRHGIKQTRCYIKVDSEWTQAFSCSSGFHHGLGDHLHSQSHRLDIALHLHNLATSPHIPPLVWYSLCDILFIFQACASRQSLGRILLSATWH